MNDRSRARHRLLAQRAAVAEALAGLDAAAAPVELDQARVGRLSRMDALQGQAMAAAGRQRLGLELARVDAALRRVDADIYGDCLECGEAIAAARLEADPSATHCLDCAERGER